MSINLSGMECDGVGSPSMCAFPRYLLHEDHHCNFCDGIETPSDNKVPMCEECPTTPTDLPPAARGVLRGAEARPTSAEERAPPGKPIGPAPKPYPVEPPANAMDVDDTAPTNDDTAQNNDQRPLAENETEEVFEKVEDDDSVEKPEDDESDYNDEAMLSDSDRSMDTEDDMAQQRALGELVYAAMIDDSCIPKDGIEAHLATSVKRESINFLTEVDKLFQATENIRDR